MNVPPALIDTVPYKLTMTASIADVMPVVVMAVADAVCI
jgi:hypothetical protein